jgi:flagellar biosynthetic protein FlhB
MTDAGDRMIPATPRRREAARREGLGPSATPLAGAVAGILTIALLPAWIETTLPAARQGMEACLVAGVNRRVAGGEAWRLGVAVGLPTLGLVLAAATAGLAVRVILDGVSWHPGRARFDASRLNPVAGLARMCSLRTLGQLIGGLGGLAALVMAGVWAGGPLAATLATADTILEPARAFRAVWRPLAAVAAAGAVVAAVQYACARLRFERRIRMTPREFAEESRSLQADPKIKLLHQRRFQPAAASPHG